MRVLRSILGRLDDAPAAGHPDAAVFQNVLVSPYSELLDIPMGTTDHRGGPHWPDWDSQSVARHNRAGEPADVEPEEAGTSRFSWGPVAWGGAITHQFGHQIADFSMRIVPTLRAAPDATIAFSTLPRWQWHSLGDTPRYFQDVLAWLGLPQERFRLIHRPTRLRRLFVLPQAEQLYGPGPSEEHLNWMDELVRQRLPHRVDRAGTIFVSRAGTHAYMAGETYLERVMTECGVTSVRPETLPLREQLDTYLSAQKLIFSEGSALHGLQLLGRSLGNIVVVVRRSGVHERSGAHVAEHSLRPRTKSLRYLEPIRGIICGMRGGRRRVEPTGMPVVDEGQLVDALSSVMPGLSDAWDKVRFSEAQDSDILRWVERTLEAEPLRSKESWEHILTTLGELGLEHLEEPARAMMLAHPSGTFGKNMTTDDQWA